MEMDDRFFKCKYLKDEKVLIDNTGIILKERQLFVNICQDIICIFRHTVFPHDLKIFAERVISMAHIIILFLEITLERFCKISV
jgi:hypothetical protein